MRYKILISICLWSVSLCAQESFSLEEAMQYAVQNSTQMKLEQLNLADADGQILETRATGMPTVRGTVNYQHFAQLPKSLLPAEIFGGDPGTFTEVAFGLKNSLSASIEGNALLFDATFFTGLRAARLFKNLVNKRSNQTASEVRFNVAKAYLAVLIAERNREVVAKNIENLERILSDTREVYKEGFIEKLDVDRLELSLANLRAQMEGVEQLGELGYNVLKFQMGYPQADALTLSDDMDVLVGGALVEGENGLMAEELDMTVRPEYQAIKAGEALNVINIEAKRTQLYPSLYGFGNYTQTLQRDNLFDNDQPSWIGSAVVGLRLNVPIFNGTMTKHQMQRAQLDLEKTRLQLNAFEDGANLETNNARIAYRNAKRELNIRQQTLDLATSIYQVTQTKYKEGVGSSIEVSQAEGDLYQSQGNYVNSLYDLLVAKTDLEKALGKL